MKYKYYYCNIWNETHAHEFTFKHSSNRIEFYKFFLYCYHFQWLHHLKCKFKKFFIVRCVVFTSVYVSFYSFKVILSIHFNFNFILIMNCLTQFIKQKFSISIEIWENQSVIWMFLELIYYIWIIGFTIKIVIRYKVLCKLGFEKWFILHLKFLNPNPNAVFCIEMLSLFEFMKWCLTNIQLWYTTIVKQLL